MKERFVGRRIVVAGGAAGVGAAAVRRFHAEGGRVAILDRDAVQGTALAAALPGCSFHAADQSDPAAVATAAGAALAALGGCDVLFAHAGGLLVKPFHETTAEDWEALLRLNVVGMAMTVRAFLPALLSAKGAVVLTSSISGLTASPLESAYCVSKAACLQLARALAVEYRDRGLRANALCPGFIRTGHGLREIEQLTAADPGFRSEAIAALQGRICEPEEVADAALFLASDEARFVNGEYLVVDNAAMAMT